MEKTLFEYVLNIKEPWKIEKINFDSSKHRLDIWIDFKQGSKFMCPECGKYECACYDTSEKVWRHLNFFEHKCYLHCRTPCVECEGCGVHQVNVPWAREKSGFTLLLEGLIILMAQNMPVSGISKIIGEHDTRIYRVISHYVNEARKKEDFSQI